MHIRDFPAVGKSSLDTLSCTLAKGKWFPDSAFLCPHSRRGTSNSLLVGIRHTQKLEGDLQRGEISTVLVRRLRELRHPVGRGRFLGVAEVESGRQKQKTRNICCPLTHQ
jgi:hypothetical protein